ncbi:MAG: hypothetical protein Q7R91_01120 [bacterium]|nr:hypothetical protein [bacterium]
MVWGFTARQSLNWCKALTLGTKLAPLDNFISNGASHPRSRAKLTTGQARATPPSHEATDGQAPGKPACRQAGQALQVLVLGQ